MQTLRSFAQRVLGGGSHAYFSKPDRLSESYELRRLQVFPSGKRPATDFYELYWAHLLRGNKARHLVEWLRTLLFRRPSVVPQGLRPVWWLTWLLVVATGLLWLIYGSLSQALGLAAGTTAVLALLQGAILHRIGDAARYLDAHPDNVASRHAIRQTGVEVVRRMHECGEYDRIVLVGHSLGSVIAYDLISYLWQEYGHLTDDPQSWPPGMRVLKGKAQPALVSVGKLGTQLAGPSGVEESMVRDFQIRQRECWRELRAAGNPWLITDLITLGSPLAHAAMLLARDESELRERIGDRELPTCPPARSGKGIYSYKGATYQVEGQNRRVRVPHHAAAFVCTRWTNIYYPLRAGFLGDLAGGPIAPTLGPGIYDRPVTGSKIGSWPLVPHVRYWRDGPGGKADKAIGYIKQALDLGSADWLP